MTRKRHNLFFDPDRMIKDAVTREGVSAGPMCSQGGK
jgi:hypothetical protein